MGLFDIFRNKEELLRNPEATAQHPDVGTLTVGARHYEIMRESIDIIGETTNPDTFFSRYNLAVKHAKMLIELFPNYELGTIAESELEILEDDKDIFIEEFLDRCNDEEKLPFIKNEIMAHRSEMSDESYEYFLELTGCYDEKTYTFCSVVFNEGGKSYYYLSDEDDVRCGDTVVVFVGKDEIEKTARVVKVEKFKGKNAPIPVDSLKYIVDVL